MSQEMKVLVLHLKLLHLQQVSLSSWLNKYLLTDVCPDMCFWDEKYPFFAWYNGIISF